jgi:hypothetical protein
MASPDGRPERRINRRQQGDLGEASAIDWFTREGATVSMPLGHSPDYDLIAEHRGRLLRVQVKTSTSGRRTPSGQQRWIVAIRTNGGNQSWTGITKRFNPAKVDLLFVLVGDGRRWCIPTGALEAGNGLNLGGRKYSEFEVERTDPILPLVLEVPASDPRIQPLSPGERRSRRAGPVCKIGASVLSEFDSHLPHSFTLSARRRNP